MLQNHLMVMDEYLVGPISTAPAYTGQNWNTILGGFDRMAIHMVVDNITATGTGNSVFLIVDHSADGFEHVISTAPKYATADQAIAAQNAISGGSFMDVWGFDQGTIPSLNSVRFRVYFSANTVSAHVKIYVTGRYPRPR